MASSIINPGGPGGYVIPKRRNPPAEEEKKRERQRVDDDAKIASSSRALDKKNTATGSSNSSSTNSSAGGVGTVPAHHTVPIRHRINVWTGSLRFEDQTVESVDLYSPFRDSAKPTGFSASLDIKLLITISDCQKYAPVADLLNSRVHGILLRRPHSYVCLPRSSPSSNSSSSHTPPMQASYLFLTNTFSPLFARIYDRLKAKQIVAMSVLADTTVLFLLPEGILTERLGIPAHDKPVFHCIFLRPRPDITEDLCQRGLLTLEQIPAEPTAHEKLDGADETVLALVDKYRRTCGLPTAKRSAPSPLNSLLSPGKAPPGGKPPTPYIPTPGYAPAALLKQQRNISYGYHSTNQDDWQSLLQPPPPPPPSVQASVSGGTPRGILSHTSGGKTSRHRDGTERDGTTDSRIKIQPSDWVMREDQARPKNQTLFKNALEQIRKINEDSKSTTSSSDPDQIPILRIPPLKTPSPQRPKLAASTTTADDQQQLPPLVPPTVPRDPRLVKHGTADKPNYHQSQPQSVSTTNTLALSAAPQPAVSRKTSEIPIDSRPNSIHSPPCDPRLKRSGAAPVPPPPLGAPPLPPPPNSNANKQQQTKVPVLDVRPMSSSVVPPPKLSAFKQGSPSPPAVAAPNLGFKRSYGVGAMSSSSTEESLVIAMSSSSTEETLPPEEKKKKLPHDTEQQQPAIVSVPIIHVESDETIIDGDVPMEIDDDDDERPYSPSQVIPLPPPQPKMDDVTYNNKDEYLDDDEEIIEEEHVDAVEKDADKSGEVEIVRQQNGGTETVEDENEDREEQKEGESVDEENDSMTGQMQIVDDDTVQQQTLSSPELSDTRKVDDAGFQSPISLVQSLIPGLSPKGSPTKVERRAKISASVSLNASGFGFDFLNWNSSVSPAKEAQMNSSSSSSNSSSLFRADESFDVEQLLKQAEIAVTSKRKKSIMVQEEEKEDKDMRVLNHQKETASMGENQIASAVSSCTQIASAVSSCTQIASAVSSCTSTPQSPVNNTSSISLTSIPTIPSSPAMKPVAQSIHQLQQQQTSPLPPLLVPALAVTSVPPPQLNVTPLAMANNATGGSVNIVLTGGGGGIKANNVDELQRSPPPANRFSTGSSVNIVLTGGSGGGIKANSVDELQRSPPPANRFVPLAPTTTTKLLQHTPLSQQQPTIASAVRPIATIHPSYRMHRMDVPPPVLHIPPLHRLDVPPPVLHMPPPPVLRAATSAASSTVPASSILNSTVTAADHSNDKNMTPTLVMNHPCTAVVLLDPEMIMCCRIKLDELRAVFVAASHNCVRVLWHQMITDKLIEVGVKAKPFLTLVDEFIAAGAVECMEPHQCDKRGLDFPKLLACSIEVAERKRRSHGEPKLRVLFLSAMIGPKSDEATKFGNNQIEVVNAGQFVEQFK